MHKSRMQFTNESEVMVNRNLNETSTKFNFSSENAKRAQKKVKVLSAEESAWLT